MTALRKFLLSFIVIIAVVIFLFSPRVVFAQNLLQNPGFEEGTNNWSLTPSTATFSATPSVKHSGDYGAIITKENASSWAYFSQKVAIEADGDYQFSGWVLLNDTAITNIKLRLYWLDAGETKISSTPVEIELREKNSSFQFLQTEPALSPPNAQFVEVQGYVYLVQKNPPNPAVFDDLIFEKVMPPSPTPTPTPTPESTATPTPTTTPTPTPKLSTPTLTKKITPTPTGKIIPTPTLKIIPTVATDSGEVLGEEVSTISAFYPYEATDEAEKNEATPSARNKIFPKIFLIGGLLLLFVSASWLWYTFKYTSR